jgi:hypothetical protein
MHPDVVAGLFLQKLRVLLVVRLLKPITLHESVAVKTISSGRDIKPLATVLAAVMANLGPVVVEANANWELLVIGRWRRRLDISGIRVHWYALPNLGNEFVIDNGKGAVAGIAGSNAHGARLGPDAAGLRILIIAVGLANSKGGSLSGISTGHIRDSLLRTNTWQRGLRGMKLKIIGDASGLGWRASNLQGIVEGVVIFVALLAN